MRHRHNEAFLHLVWGTCDRAPLLREPLREQVYACIRAECHKLEVQVLDIGGTEDHVHLLVRLDPNCSIALLVNQAKGVSSHPANHAGGAKALFRWQGGYAVIAVGPREVDRVRAYIRGQAEHHAGGRGGDAEMEPLEVPTDRGTDLGPDLGTDRP
ncbi:MAG: IS200/IS605 family transposase [Armatimonadetes bacterium]|nr:IS200/IS605 family transposase [Armatimonadota bacterium]